MEGLLCVCRDNQTLTTCKSVTAVQTRTGRGASPPASFLCVHPMSTVCRGRSRAPPTPLLPTNRSLVLSPVQVHQSRSPRSSPPVTVLGGPQVAVVRQQCLSLEPGPGPRRRPPVPVEKKVPPTVTDPAYDRELGTRTFPIPTTTVSVATVVPGDPADSEP